MPTSARFFDKKWMQCCLQWIQSHSGITGNGFADLFPKAETKLPQSDLPSSYRNIKRIVKAKFKACFQETIASLTSGKILDSFWDNPISYDLPRQVSVANFRTLIGHDYLRTFWTSHDLKGHDYFLIDLDWLTLQIAHSI